MIKKKSVSTKPLRDFLSFLKSSVIVTVVPPPLSGDRSTRVALTFVLPDLLHLTVLVPSLPPHFSLTGRFPRWTFFHKESNRWGKRYCLLTRASKDDRSHQFTSEYVYVCLPWEILIIAGTLIMKSTLPPPPPPYGRIWCHYPLACLAETPSNSCLQLLKTGIVTELALKDKWYTQKSHWKLIQPT